MTPAEARYRSTVNRIAFSLLIFYGAFNVYSVLISVIVPLFTSRMSVVAGDVTYELLYGVLYAAVFIGAGLFFYLFSRHEPHRKIEASFSLPRETPLYILASLAITSAAAYLNTFLLEIFEYEAFTEELLLGSEITANYQLVLMFFTLAIVPAFAEEFLFRGVILNNLLPFGRTTAVVASALLFGLMHQNMGQFLYTTVAGLVIGFIYVHTKSIWCCILTHLCNNFMSVLYTAIEERLSEEAATPLLLSIELCLFTFGVASAIFLILLEKNKRKQILLTGVFEREYAPDPEAAEQSIPLSRRIKLFFSVPMIVFIVLCAVQMTAILSVAIFI